MAKSGEGERFDPKKHRLLCNLCQKEMDIYEYDRHYDKCLAITTLLPLMREEGQRINYKDLDEYDMSSLDKLLEKYIPGINEPKGIYTQK